MQRFDCLAQEIPLFGPHFLEASAGTGKTFTIEHIFARLLLSGVSIDQILIVTFTRAATRELKFRLRTNLEKILTKGCPYIDASQSLEKIESALATFDRSQIYTIHGFCFRMLKEFAFEVELPLSMKESAVAEKLDAALRDFFEIKLSGDIVSPEQLEVLLRTMSVEEIAQKLKKKELPKAAKTYGELQAAFKQKIGELDLQKLREDFAALRDSYRKKEGNFDAQLIAIAAKELGPLISEKGSIFSLIAPENKKVKAKEAPFLHYPGFYDWGRENLLPLIQSESLPALLSVWKPIEQKIVLEEGAFGPDALLQWMQQAIQKKPFREKVQKKYRAVLIDEFQDTDPIQWEIFQTLFLDAETLYLIGDPKQSIYRFRKADLYTYLSAKEAITPERHFHLDTNFRSSQELMGALNRLFDRNWLELPKEKKALTYIPVRAGLDLRSQFSDAKGAIHCLLFEGEGIFSYVAAEILRLKTNVASFSSFAILVKDRYQAAKIEEVLKALGIPTMARSHELLRETLAFSAIEELFAALEDPRNLGKVKAVAAGPFGELDCFLLRELLEQKGLAALCRVLPYIGPESLQVFELLFEWERNAGFSYEGIGRFFAQCKTSDPEEALGLWKETEVDAVQILTMHGSKGLEFDIVFALGASVRTVFGDEETEAEKERLLYVALTRAKRRLYLPIPFEKKGGSVGRLSPIELFCKRLGKWEEELQKMGQEVSLTLERIEGITLPKKIESQTVEEEKAPLKIPTFDPSYLLSFTAIAQESASVLEPMEEPNGVYTIHNLPRGAETGILIHSIFERVFSNDPYVDLIPKSLSAWKEAIANMVETVLDLPLLPGFCLRKLDPSCVRTEVEFFFKTSPNYMVGFIDLIFVYNKTLYFVDWKTNWLGKDAGSYSPEKLANAMQQHQYHLQASIYAEALRRSWSGPIGGGLYVFVRGPKVQFIKI